MKINIYQNNLLFIAIITILLISLKWVQSYLNFPYEDINLRVIYDINDSSYFPLIKSFENWNFKPSYSINENSSNFISFPILSLSINILLFKIFGSYSFLIIEFISVTIFISIFFYIFKGINISNHFSLLFALLLFIFPFFIEQLATFDNLILQKISLNLSSFYNLRNPRPLITNLYLFISLLYLLKIFYLEEQKLSNYVILAIVVGLTLHTFFYFFLFQLVLFAILNLKKNNLNLKKILCFNYKQNIIFTLIIFIFALIFILQLYLSESDYMQRLGMKSMSFDQKRIMIDYMINFFTKIEFVTLFLLNTFIFFFNRKKLNDLFYYLFLSTILSTTFFILISSRSTDYYHFFNWILITGTLYIIISFFVIFYNYVLTNLSTKSKKILLTSSFFLIILFFNFTQIKGKNFTQTYNNDRDSMVEVINFIKSDTILSNKKFNILTLNYESFVWLVLNDYKNFFIVPNSFWTSKKTSDIENELISTFKILNLSENDFIKFFKNEKKGYRYINQNTRMFFDRLYLANNVFTFNDLSNFTNEHKNFIKNTSPLYSHQLIIPKNEFERFKNKFNIHKNENYPDILILDNKNKIISKHNLNKDKYCLKYTNSQFKIYISKTIIDSCNLVKN